MRPTREAAKRAREILRQELAEGSECDSTGDTEYANADSDGSDSEFKAPRTRVRARRRLDLEADPGFQTQQRSSGASAQGGHHDDIRVELGGSTHRRRQSLARPRRSVSLSVPRPRVTRRVAPALGTAALAAHAVMTTSTTPSGRQGQARSVITPSRTSKVNFVLGQPVNFGVPEECPHCGARVWHAERSNGSWLCCRNGKEVLPASLFPPVDPSLRELYSQRKFSFHSRSINNHLAFTSIGTTPSTGQGGKGMNFRLPFPSSARLQGKTYHVMSATTQCAPGYGANLYYIQVRVGCTAKPLRCMAVRVRLQRW